MTCGDPVIDGLLAAQPSIQPLAAGAEGASVGYLQDLLRGHGYAQMPDPRSSAWGAYGPATSRAVADYRRVNGLGGGEETDSILLRDIVTRPAPKAVLGPAYVPLVLGVAFTTILRFVWLTSLFETRCALSMLNLNTDQCGVSFGILQWAQKSGQLHNVLQACHASEPTLWDAIMGGTGILDHTAKPDGGVDSNGMSIDPNFELTHDFWKTRLQNLGANAAMQRVQISLASEVYSKQLVSIEAYAHAIRSERGFAFLLDLTNQFGDPHVRQHYKATAQPGVTEAEILKKLEDTFTTLARPRFQPQVRARREFFRTTRLLSDQPLGITQPRP
jgi:peptidoglycan hydrolase-like protein with peptidoglycan-binding domain